MDEQIGEDEVTALTALAREAGPELRGPQPEAWLDRLEARRSRVDAVLDWCLANGRAGLGVDIAGEIWPWWFKRGHLPEGAAWLARLLDASPAQDPTPGRAKALAGAGNLAFHQGKFEASTVRMRESLAIFEALADSRGIAEAHGGLSRVAMAGNNADEMRRHSRIALEAARQSNDETGIAIALHHIAHASLIEGDLESAERLYGANVETYRGMRRGDLVASELHNLGHVACLRGDVQRAKALFIESLGVAAELGGNAIQPYDIIGLGRVALALGQPKQAAALLSAGMAILQREGKAVVPLLRPEVERAIATARAALPVEEHAAVEEAGRRLGVAEALALVVATAESKR